MSRQNMNSVIFPFETCFAANVTKQLLKVVSKTCRESKDEKEVEATRQSFYTHLEPLAPRGFPKDWTVTSCVFRRRKDLERGSVSV